jgi:hypothetical protein
MAKKLRAIRMMSLRRFRNLPGRHVRGASKRRERRELYQAGAK